MGGQPVLNNIIIIGRLTRDPELRYTQAGIPCASFCVAVNRGTGGEEADFFDCVAWRGTAEAVCNHTKKGMLVAVTGSMRQRKFEARSGEKRSAWELVGERVEFLDRPTARSRPRCRPNP